MGEPNQDFGAETARFQAFVQERDDMPPAWKMDAPASRVGLLIGIVVAVAVLAAIIAVAFVG
jgi:hypothetical protein